MEGKPISVKVSEANVSEVEREKVKDPLLDADDVDQDNTESNVEEDVVAEEATAGSDEDDDIFAGNDAFVAAKNALDELEIDSEEVGKKDAGSDALEGLDDTSPLATDETEPDQVGTLQVFNENCFRCTHLIPELKSGKHIKAKKFSECHFENGNEECPAKTVIIVVGIPIQKIVKMWMGAHIDGDNERKAKIEAKLATKDEVQRELANKAISKALKEYYTKAG
jgi:hypothetical protein